MKLIILMHGLMKRGTKDGEKLPARLVRLSQKLITVADNSILDFSRIEKGEWDMQETCIMDAANLRMLSVKSIAIGDDPFQNTGFDKTWPKRQPVFAIACFFLLMNTYAQYFPVYSELKRRKILEFGLKFCETGS